MDQTLMKLIEKEKIARNQLEWADGPDQIQTSIDVLEKARQVTSAYLVYKKKESEYNIATKERDRSARILRDLDKILK